ncbi:hypothetical protein NPIL_647501, partial [Nephila pilipes]
YKRSIVEIDNPKETLQVLGNLAQRILEAEGISKKTIEHLWFETLILRALRSLDKWKNVL